MEGAPPPTPRSDNLDSVVSGGVAAAEEHAGAPPRAVRSRDLTLTNCSDDPLRGLRKRSRQVALNRCCGNTL